MKNVFFNSSKSLLIVSLAFVLCFACTVVEEPIILVATSIEVSSGNNQSAEISSPLPNPIEIRVNDQDGNAFAGATVIFGVAETVGGPAAEGSVSSVNVETNGDGIASVTWTLGSLIGTQTLTITAFDAAGNFALQGSPILINATAEPPPVPTSVTDIDGNTYAVVLIDDQIWMAENLKVTRYDNNGSPGDAIPFFDETQNAGWGALGDNDTDRGYGFYEGQGETYGAFYTYATAINGTPFDGTGNVQGVCPTDWHLPNDTEWLSLQQFLGGESVAGAEVKETGTLRWNAPNTGATNSSGFTALPAGYRNYDDGGSEFLGRFSPWWSANEFIGLGSFFRAQDDDTELGGGLTFKSYGMAVRCIKD